MRPVIAITAGFDEERQRAVLGKAYIDSIIEAGGIPILIPVMKGELAEKLLSIADGVLFPGGVDMDPKYFDERPSQKLGRINPLLDEVELAVARKALATNMPLLGICRGCQVVTIAAGGSVVQDIPSQIGGAMKHSQQAPRWYGTHEVILDEDSLAHSIFKNRRLTVNSFHHQSVKEPGDGFSVTGKALDGVVEALEANNGFKLLMQWHPECMWPREPIFLEPFKALCKAAKG